MPDYTSKQIPKPLGADNQDVTVIRSAFDRINDYSMGAFVCTSTTRPTGSNLWDGLLIWETDTKAYGIYDGADWQMFDTVWQTYPLTFNNFTPGPSILVGKYFRRGKTLQLFGRVILADGFAMNSNNIEVGLPAGKTMPPEWMDATVGGVDYTKSGVGYYPNNVCRVNATTSFALHSVNATTPTAPASGDGIRWSAQFEIV